MVVLVVYSWAVVRTWSDHGLARSWDAANPDVAVASRLVSVLFLLIHLNRLEEVEGRLRSAGLLFMQLDRAADAVQRGLPRILSPHDPTNPAVLRLAPRFAAGLRELKRYIAASLSRRGGEASTEAVGKIKGSLDAWVSGGVDDLPQSDPEPVVSQPKQLAVVLRRALAAIAPIAVLGLVRLSPFHSVELTGALATFSMLWLVSFLLRSLLGDDFEKYLGSSAKLAGVIKGGDDSKG
jgi:hypothetical protein